MIEERIIVGENSSYPLQGILTLPSESEVPVPAVVFVHGSGSSNMDEKVLKLTPFKDLAQGLARHGIASIRYDKRTFTYGRQMVKDKNLIVTVKEETIDDAILATELLRNDPRINKNKIFIIGHSMGGMLAPRIDHEGGNYTGLILLAGTPRRLDEVVIDQFNGALQVMNPFLRLLTSKKIKKMIAEFENLFELSDEVAKRTNYAGGITMYYFKEMGEYPTTEYLQNSLKPILIMQGEDDIQVSVEKDFKEYQRILVNKENVTYKLYPGLNHAFVKSRGSNILNATKEFSVAQCIGENVIQDIADWVERVCE